MDYDGDTSSSNSGISSLTSRVSLALIITISVVLGVILLGSIGYAAFWKFKNGWYSAQGALITSNDTVNVGVVPNNPGGMVQNRLTTVNRQRQLEYELQQDEDQKSI